MKRVASRKAFVLGTELAESRVQTLRKLELLETFSKIFFR